VPDTLPIACLNGDFLPVADCTISPLDRAFLFGDAIYEVIPVFAGRPFLIDAHLQRLIRSLQELRIDNPHTTGEWQEIVGQLISRNGGASMSIYIQVSRGADNGRDHVFPDATRPTVFAMAAALPALNLAAGIRAITLPDNRWGRCDIKATALLANVLARQQAREAGAADAILLWNGFVTEGATSSVIVVVAGELIRRPHGQEVLSGTTTDHVINLARESGFTCREQPLSESQLRSADEIWLTSATKGIAPVVYLDDDVIGDGTPGKVWQQVIKSYEASKSG
jgi:D-alanine transaminase